MLDVIVSIVLTVIVLPVLYFAYTTIRRPTNFPPGPTGLPFVGSFHLAIPTHINHSKIAKIYGDIFSVKISNEDAICISGYNLIKEVLIDRAKEFSDRRQRQLGILTRGKEFDGIVVSNYGPKLVAHRKMFHSAFRNMGMNNQGIERYITEELSTVLEEFEKSRDHEKIVDPSTILHFATLNVVGAFAFGTRCSYNDLKFKKLLEVNTYYFEKIMVIAKSVLLLIVLHLPFLYRIWLPKAGKDLISASNKIKDFAKSEIERHKQTIDPQSPRDFIDYYLLEMKKEDNKWFTGSGLEATIADLFQAGTETVATTLRWGLLYMANNPTIQDKVHEEIDRAIGMTNPPNYKNRLSMPYCEATVLEIQRKASVAPRGLFRTPSNDTTIRGYNITKDTCIVTDLYSMHHSPKHWKNPYNFDPENFLDADGKVITKDAFMPFGAGLRICVGMNLAKQELFLFFVGILQKFEIKLPDGVEALSEEPVAGLTLKPNPYKLQFIKRF